MYDKEGFIGIHFVSCFIAMKKNILLLPILLTACANVAPTPLTVATSPPTIVTTTPSAVPSPIPTIVPTPSGPRFPRLGMLWPNTHEQPLEQIARYDWVILGDWQTDFVDPLHALNPDLRLLISTSASELNFKPDDLSYNSYLQQIPYQWYLTQVGTTLHTDIDAKQEILPVEALTVNGQEGEIHIFVPGDTALIEDESVYIKSVNQLDRTLTVQRGYIRPASAHKAGTRIAAHITFWPNTWVLNLSTLSPTGIVDPSVGPERWADYNARMSAQVVADPRWAGIFVDRSDPNESWLIGNSTARTIDPDQSNHLLTDYSTFDESWNDGLRSYLDQLRAAIGPDRIMYLNWGITHYAAVNGNNFEGIPDDSWYHPWHAQIFGPIESGSYFDWMSQARQPNLTMIETYEDNSRPNPNDTGKYPKDCSEKSFVPNYQKMRFGLTSALLNDGYFSYEMNTHGHGSLCLMWFDEYDNAGAGRGYLGYPVGPAQQLADLIIPNLLPTYGLDSSEELSAWDIWSDNGYSISIQSDPKDSAQGSGSARIDIPQAQGDIWRAALAYDPLTLTKDTDYSLIFYARADKVRTIYVWVQQDHEPWKVWLPFGELSLTTDWQKFAITIASSGNDTHARLIFGMGATTGSVWLDELRFYKGNADIWRRDFENGVIFVNASAETVTIPLEAPYKKIDGTQDRVVNDGSRVSQITLEPEDGIILLKPK